MPVTVREIAWLAGIVEGEGCIHLSGASAADGGRSPAIAVAMTDRDVIENVARLWNRHVYVHYPAAPRKPRYSVVVCGAAAAGWLMTLYPLLHARRRAKAAEVMRHWCAHGLRKVYRPRRSALLTAAA